MIPNAQLTTTQWLSLPQDVRVHLIKVFGIPRSEGSHVMDGKVTSDGHNHRDLAVITIGRLRAFLKEGTAKPDSEFDFVDLFNHMLDKVEMELVVPPAAEPSVTVLSQEPIVVNGVEYAPVNKKERLGVVKESDIPKAPAPIVAPKTKNKGGRPKGSKNKSK